VAINGVAENRRAAAQAGAMNFIVSAGRCRGSLMRIAWILAVLGPPIPTAGSGHNPAVCGGAALRRRTSGGLSVHVYRDAAGLHLGLLRDGHLEHAIGLLRRDGLGVRALGQREATQEGARGALDALVAILRVLLFRASLTADRQHALLGRDVDILRLDAGDIRQDDEAVLLL